MIVFANLIVIEIFQCSTNIGTTIIVIIVTIAFFHLAQNTD